ncbi:hypothetical protein HK097_008980, partial [Rhizophlyctis rosea]
MTSIKRSPGKEINTKLVKKVKTENKINTWQLENEFREKYQPTDNDVFNAVMMAGKDNCKLFIPSDTKGKTQFFKNYLQTVRAGCRMTLKEQMNSKKKDKRIKFMIDLDFDFDSDTPPMKSLLNSINSVVQNKYKETYGDRSNEWIIEKRSDFKWHIIFYNIIDNQEEFATLSQQLGDTCRTKFGNDWDWDKIFDVSVYTNNGLRLPYSYKNKRDDNVRRDETGKALDPEFYEICDENWDGIDMNSVTVEQLLHRNILPTDDELARCPIPAKAATIKKKEPVRSKVEKPGQYTGIYAVFNKILGLDKGVEWEMESNTDGSHQLIPDIKQCLVNPTHEHSRNSHSCLYIRKRSVIFNCFSCGKHTLPTKDALTIVKVFKEHVLGEEKEEGEKPFVRLRNALLQEAGSKQYRRDNQGNVWRPIEDLTYAYEYYKCPKDFLNEVFLDDNTFGEHPDNMDRLIKFMQHYDRSEFPFMVNNRHYLGFKNGVLNIITCEFTPAAEVEEGLTVRKYYDRVLDPAATDTPLFDKLLKLQFPDEEKGGDHEGVYDFILMSLGRLFFNVGERDNWQYMLYLEGDAGTGRSTVMNIVSEFFDKIGTISASYEKTFGLSSLYDQEVIIIDDLPTNFKDVFPQTEFQSMVSGGFVQVRGMHKTGVSVKWSVTLLWGGNWSLDYLDKGQITRRVLNAVFEVLVTQIDPTLQKRIIEHELGTLMLKCLRTYKNYTEKFCDKGVWDFAPEYFKITQREMRSQRNPLFRFLTEDPPHVHLVMGETVLEYEVKKAFERYLNKPCGKLDPQTFTQANPNWR